MYITAKLGWNMIGEEGAEVLSHGTFLSLQELDLRKNYIGNKGLEHLSRRVNKK